MKQRIFSVVLSLCLCMSFQSVAYANEMATSSLPTKEATIKDSSDEADNDEDGILDEVDNDTKESLPEETPEANSPEEQEREKEQEEVEEQEQEKEQEEVEEQKQEEEQKEVEEQKQEEEQEEMEEQEEEDELTVPDGVWSDKAPSFSEDESSQSEGQPFRMARASGICPTYKEAYEAMIGLQNQYPEGMTWTNFEPYGSKGELGNSYRFQGGAIKGASLGVGCAAFAFILSDEAFGSLPARTIDRGSFAYEDIKVGDILRVNNNSHFVIVLQVSSGGVIVAEANYNKSVHWGRSISVDEIMSADFLVTRYPEGYTEEDNADETAQKGEEGSLRWRLTNSGTLTISGIGNMPNYSENARPSWNAYNDNINTIIIEDGITSVGDFAFFESKALTVYIPEGIASIGTSAFQESNLVSVTIPETTESVGNNAFRDCANLTSVSISDGVKTIGDNAFQACVALKYLDFPASITSVGTAAFTSCNAIVQIRFASSGDVTIGDSAFAQCQYLRSVTLPQGLTKISNFMFQSCTSLAEIYIPASVTDIGENPFTSTGIFYSGTISFGGSETTWKTIGGQFILNSMPYTNIVYNVAYDDPFAVDPDDPGDFKPENPGENDSNNPGDSGSGDDTPGGSDSGTDNPGDSGNGDDTPGGSDSGTDNPGDSGNGDDTPGNSGNGNDNPGSGAGNDTPGESGSNTPGGNKPGNTSGENNSSGNSNDNDSRLDNVQTEISSTVSDSINSGIRAVMDTWKPATPEEAKRYACMGKEPLQYTPSKDNVYPITMENAIQGPKCFQSFEAVLEDYTIGRTYNIYPPSGHVYSMDKEIQITLRIPSEMCQKGREYKMICVTKGGEPIVFNDLDSDLETITIKTNKFYAFALIYK